MKRTILLLTSLMLFSLAVFGQKATKVEIKADDSPYDGGTLYVTVGGKKRKIADNAKDVWIINQGNEVVYSFGEMSRGFEGEGESLNLYNVKTGKTRQIMAEYTFVTGLSEVKLSNGSNVLLVSMGDGGLGGSYFAVVDPKRGELFDEHLAELIEVKGDKISLAYYKQEDWDAINQERDWEDLKGQSAFAKPTKVKPEKTQTFDLNEILKNKVMVNKTNEELGKEYVRKYSSLTIYQWRPKDQAPGKEYFLMGVIKDVPKTISPLRKSLELLFADTTAAEKQDGWESAVFGMRFEGVILKAGVATIKFSQPEEKRKMLSFAPKMFLEAVERTAKQFPNVKTVKICEVGGTTFAFDAAPQIPKCAAN
jgi:hypothetical protein